MAAWFASLFDSADGRADTPAILLIIGFLALTGMELHAQFVMGRPVDAMGYGGGVAALVAAFVGAGAFKRKDQSNVDRP